MRHRHLLTIWLCLAGSTVCAASLPYDEVALGGAKVKLPTIGFVAACDENAQFRANVKAMTPPTHDLLTCMVRPDKWKAAQSGAATDLTPVIVVTELRPPAGGGFTAKEFTMMRDRAYAEPAKVIPATGESFKGFFETPVPSSSFSFLVEGAGPEQGGGHVKSVSSLYFAGHLLSVMVVDQATGNADGHRTRDVTLDWLHAFQSLNASVSR
jgi:hypothetical protein